MLQIQAQLCQLTEIDKIITLETVLDKPEELLHELQQTLILEPGTYCMQMSAQSGDFADFKLHKTEDGDDS